MEYEHFENQEHEWESNLKVTEGVEGPIQVNPNALERMKRNQQQLMPLEWYVDGILKGDRVTLSKAITLVESSLLKHQELAQQIIANPIGRYLLFLVPKRFKYIVKILLAGYSPLPKLLA